MTQDPFHLGFLFGAKAANPSCASGKLNGN
jgi:hypothetical protein